jgi:hypothetical protein
VEIIATLFVKATARSGCPVRRSTEIRVEKPKLATPIGRASPEKMSPDVRGAKVEASERAPDPALEFPEVTPSGNERQ